MKSVDSISHIECTYRELAKALEQLNFKNESNEKYFIYSNRKHDIRFMLAKRTDESAVSSADIAGITFHLTWKGLTTNRYGLGRIIEQIRELEQKDVT